MLQSSSLPAWSSAIFYDDRANNITDGQDVQQVKMEAYVNSTGMIGTAEHQWGGIFWIDGRLG